MNNKTIIYEKHCIEQLAKELPEVKKELVQEYLEVMYKKFNNLLEENKNA